MIVCLDGPAGSGKSTISRLVAKKAGFVHLDTGAFFRSLALQATRAGISLDNEEKLAELTKSLDIRFKLVNGENSVIANDEDVSTEIRTPEMSHGASKVSRHKAVRAKMLDLQRNAARDVSSVAEGRDTATVVFPEAELKIYLDADVEERAKRRLKDYRKQNKSISISEVVESLKARDKADMERETAPLTMAKDSIRLDTTNMTIEEVIIQILTWIEEKRGN